MSNNYICTGTLVANTISATTLTIGTVVSSGQLVGHNEINRDSTSFIVGNATSAVNPFTEGIHVGYDNVGKVGSIYVMGLASGVKDLYLNMPTSYTGTPTVHMLSATANSLTAETLNSNLTLSGNGTGTVMITGGVSFAGNIVLPVTSSNTIGSITQGGNSLLHTFGTSNTYLGSLAGNYVSTGLGLNVGIGANSLNGITSANRNVALGANAMKNATTTSFSIAIGFNAMGTGITTGNENTAIGSGTLAAVTSGGFNIGIGNAVLTTLTTTTFNTVIGYTAMQTATGGENTAIGSAAMQSAGTASQNVAIGNGTCRMMSTGTLNTAIGYTTMNVGVVTGTANVAIGVGSMRNLTSGSNNVSVGNGSCLSLSSGQFNTAVGVNCMGAGITTGNENAALGSSALNVITSGTRNIGVGNGAFLFMTTGSDNTGIGYVCGRNLVSGINNIFIGKNAGNNLTGAEANNLYIGHLQLGTLGESSAIRIGSTSTTCFIQGIQVATAVTTAKLVGVSSTDQLMTAPTSMAVSVPIISSSTYQMTNGGGTTILATAATTNNTYNLPLKTAGTYTLLTANDQFQTVADFTTVANAGALADAEVAFDYAGSATFPFVNVIFTIDKSTAGTLNVQLFDFTNSQIIANLAYSGAAGLVKQTVVAGNIPGGAAIFRLKASVDAGAGKFYAFTLRS